MARRTVISCDRCLTEVAGVPALQEGAVAHMEWITREHEDYALECGVSVYIRKLPVKARSEASFPDTCDCCRICVTREAARRLDALAEAGLKNLERKGGEVAGDERGPATRMQDMRGDRHGPGSGSSSQM